MDEFFKSIVILYSKELVQSLYSQLQDTPLEHDTAIMYNLAETCKFQGMNEEIIQDRFVVGVQVPTLSECRKWIDYLT